jgi:predicted phosphoribosyltransferase
MTHQTLEEAWALLHHIPEHATAAVVRASHRAPGETTSSWGVVVSPLVVAGVPAGAVAERDVTVLDPPRGLHVAAEELVRARAAAHREITRACHGLGREPGARLRAGTSTVILSIDHGVSPCEARAAVRALRAGGATRVIADVSDATRAVIDALGADGIPFVTRPTT